MTGCKLLAIPMPQNLKLLPYMEGKTKKEDLLNEPERYRRLIGKLIYLTMARPDISFSVYPLSQFMQSPTRSHMAAAKGIVRYLKGSVGLGIFLSSEGEPEFTCYCDSDWASCGITRRSVIGYLLKFGGSLVMWKMKK
ncbi:uncharacterized protein LOC114725062 [Neltuma alba]|uniref:uncharacterized protein LOC114725062 n=1 Tax=Neltuma alba TaxID=207710 RepID=UPI0010A5184F|nr:uncharacterized protein LOC114725062 [Prosopis alba]